MSIWFKSLALLVFIALTACVPPVFPEDSLPFYEERPVYGVFSGSYDDVWTAAVDAMDLYPVEMEEKERGLLVTEWQLSTSDFIYDQYGATYIPAKIKYRMRIHVKAKEGRTVVTIISHEQVEKDMISANLDFTGAIYNWIDVPSSTCKEREILEGIRTALSPPGDEFDPSAAFAGCQGRGRQYFNTHVFVDGQYSRSLTEWTRY